MLTYEQNVKAILESVFAGYKDELIENACKMICTLNDSEKQEPKTGYWIESHVPESVLVECLECGFSCGAPSFNYCPMCGAKMQEVEE